MLETARHIIKMTEYLLDDPALKEFFLKFGESGLKSGLKFILYVGAKNYNLPDDVKGAINPVLPNASLQKASGICLLRWK
jgi:hypothetical protein